MQELLKQKDEEISSLTKTLKQKEGVIKSNEERMSTIAILEHMLKSQKESHKKDLENIRNYYEQELASVTKEVQHTQRVLSINLPLEDKIKLLEEELTSTRDFSFRKIQMLENRIKQLSDIPTSCEREETEPMVLFTDPGEEGRYSARTGIPGSSILKARNFDLNSHRCSTEIHVKGSENKIQIKQSPSKRKRDLINELKSTPVIRPRNNSKGSNKGDQEQQGVNKSQRHVENYFNYLKRRLDNLQQVNEKEREHLRSFDGRKGGSGKKSAYLNGSIGAIKEKSCDKVSKGENSKIHEDRSECIATDRQALSVPKLLRNVNNTIHTKMSKY